jgi:hypothetical protein
MLSCVFSGFLTYLIFILESIEIEEAFDRRVEINEYLLSEPEAYRHDVPKAEVHVLDVAAANPQAWRR